MQFFKEKGGELRDEEKGGLGGGEEGRGRWSGGWDEVLEKNLSFINN